MEKVGVIILAAGRGSRMNSKDTNKVDLSVNDRPLILRSLDIIKSAGVDEIVVVNNNAEPGTVEEVQKTKARMVYEKRQGYGYAFQKGMKEAKGDYVVLCEPDGTYKGKDD